ncbi:hypothetical protein NYR97_19875 [Xanthomonas hydrangeae]|uniref:Uncharacterized protein n=1 Tax=Xanthomonas hydrangeae TaxID=2775159 RepID=A0AAU0BB56_9XANT|nr:hypothetical protein [Xanthomonas hydrangeae]WOB49429.1 hypothetical protein NYR97_19875 [Xanthomonas hydrangeae]
MISKDAADLIALIVFGCVIAAVVLALIHNRRFLKRDASRNKGV